MVSLRRAATLGTAVAVLAGSTLASAATLSWNVPGGTPSGDYFLVYSESVTIELIAQLGPNEVIADYAYVTAETAGGIYIQISNPSQVPLTSTVNGNVVPWEAYPRPYCSPDCRLVEQVNTSAGHPVDPFSGVIATLDVHVFEGTVWARAQGADNQYFFGASDTSVKLLLVPEPTAAGLLGFGLSALAIARRDQRRRFRLPRR